MKRLVLSVGVFAAIILTGTSANATTIPGYSGCNASSFVAIDSYRQYSDQITNYWGASSQDNAPNANSLVSYTTQRNTSWSASFPRVIAGTSISAAGFCY